jgi:hypothetical protein
MSKNKHYLRYKNIIIGYFHLVNEKLLYIPIPELAGSIDGWRGYPRGLYPVNEHELPNLIPLVKYTPTEEDIRGWLSERVFPENRQGSHKLLNSMGLSKYDEWEIAKRTKAISHNDFYGLVRIWRMNLV